MGLGLAGSRRDFVRLAVAGRHVRWITIGLRREERNRWEMRAPLTPAHAKELMKLQEVEIVAQPCNKRIFTDKEYSEAGVKIVDDLGHCDVILGVKEIPPHLIVPGKMHFCFSHTHKGQPHGAPLLAAFKDKAATLVDYELLADDAGKRVLAFGKFAGYAGMIDCLHGLGDRILQLGYRTPFLNIGLAHHYPSLAAAKKAVQSVAKEIEKQGLPSDLATLSFVFTGSGNVSSGAQEIFELLPHVMVKPKDYVKAVKKGGNGKLIGTVMEYVDFAKDGKSIFAQEFAPHTSVLVNGIYWDSSLPRILPKSDLASMGDRRVPQLLAIADISCDLNGGVECTTHATNIDAPFMYYDPVTGKNGDRPGSAGDIQLMTIDNLPAQLPRDASTYFSTVLSGILKSLVKAKKTTDIVRRATIVENGEFVERFKGLKTASAQEKQRVLILGSGYVAKPTVDYLSQNYQVTVASNVLEDAKRITAGVEGAKPVLLEAGDKAKLSGLVRDASVVVSLLPAAMHTDVAELCIGHGKHLVTGSYISPAMRALDKKCKAASVTVLNEIGLDPGLDHLSAMRMLDGARSQGDRIDSFVSWCGGLPAPECAGNPFGYKFSWRPQGVLLATQNAARYLLRGRTVDVAGKDLLRAAMPIKIHPAFAFEGLPNRDSLAYIEPYRLAGVQTMFRGTLRYRGFSELLASCAHIGLLGTEPLNPMMTQLRTWREVIDRLVPPAGVSTEERFATRLGATSMALKARRLIAALDWLGVMDGSAAFTPQASMLDAFAALLESRLRFQPGERDMAFMFHEVQVTSAGGKKGRLTSTLLQYGDPAGYSAMARTVGLPVAVAAEMLLQGRVKETGVLAPLSPDLYNSMLPRLAQAGITFTESTGPL